MDLTPDGLRLVAILDNSIRQSFVQSKDHSFRWLLLSTAGVVFGVVLEAPEVFYELRNVFQGTPTKHDSSRPPWIVVLATLGWLLIVGGVVGESLFEYFATEGDEAIQLFDNSEVLQAKREASKSQLEAARANERAAIVERSNEELRIQQTKSRIEAVTVERGLAEELKA